MTQTQADKNNYSKSVQHLWDLEYNNAAYGLGNEQAERRHPAENPPILHLLIKIALYKAPICYIRVSSEKIKVEGTNKNFTWKKKSYASTVSVTLERCYSMVTVHVHQDQLVMKHFVGTRWFFRIYIVT